MICTYIFEDNQQNTLANATNIKDPKVYMDMKPVIGLDIWQVAECKIIKHKNGSFEKAEAKKPVRLVGAVLSAHDKVLINTAHDCFPELRSEESYFYTSDNSIFVPEHIISRHVEEQGEQVRGINVKPRYITPIIVNTHEGYKTYYAVSIIYTGATYNRAEDGKYFWQIQPNLVDLADQILDLNNISHTKNKPYHRYGHSYIQPSHIRATIPHAYFDDLDFNIVCDDNIWYGKYMGFLKDDNFLLPQAHSTWVYNMPKGTIGELIDKHINETETELFSLASFNIYNDKQFTERITNVLNILEDED